MADTRDVLSRLEAYEKKIGVGFFEDWSLDLYPQAMVFPDGSILTYAVLPDEICVGPCSGDVKEMISYTKMLCKMAGIHKFSCTTIHNPKAFGRLTKMKLVKVEPEPDEYGKTVYDFEMEVV